MGVGTVGDSYLERLGLELAHNYFMGHYQIVLLFDDILGTSINMQGPAILIHFPMTGFIPMTRIVYNRPTVD